MVRANEKCGLAPEFNARVNVTVDATTYTGVERKTRSYAHRRQRAQAALVAPLRVGFSSTRLDPEAWRRSALGDNRSARLYRPTFFLLYL